MQGLLHITVQMMLQTGNVRSYRAAASITVLRLLSLELPPSALAAYDVQLLATRTSSLFADAELHLRQQLLHNSYCGASVQRGLAAQHAAAAACQGHEQDQLVLHPAGMQAAAAHQPGVQLLLG